MFTPFAPGVGSADADILQQAVIQFPQLSPLTRALIPGLPCHPTPGQYLTDPFLREYIDKGVFGPGARLPSVRKLSAQFNISISTVLQAYARLEDLGVIEAVPQSGYYVRRTPRGLPTPPAISKPPIKPTEVSISELAMGMSLAPGPLFSAVGKYRNYMRINYSMPWNDERVAALATIGQLIEQQIEAGTGLRRAVS